MAEEFSDGVLDDFVAGVSGRANAESPHALQREDQFAAVLERSMDLGFDAVCTGHYARIAQSAAGERELHRSADPDKDQSYVLGVLTAQQLAHSMFPLGDSLKSDVRAEASERGLLVANKPDSYDICFIPDGDTAGWLRNRIGAEPGRSSTLSGEHLGNHERRLRVHDWPAQRLGNQGCAADGQPRYVVGELTPPAGS